jgi:hypothetical protein
MAPSRANGYIYNSIRDDFTPTSLFLCSAGLHAVIQDDVYKGFHIPSGAVILGNGW